MVEILTLWSPHKLLKNLGALSEYAKCNRSSSKIKKLKSLLSVLDTMEWHKKPSHATVPFFKSKTVEILVNIGVNGAELKCIICIIHLRRTSYICDIGMFIRNKLSERLPTADYAYYCYWMMKEIHLFSSFILRLSSWSVSIWSHYILLGQTRRAKNYVLNLKETVHKLYYIDNVKSFCITFFECPCIATNLSGRCMV